MSIAFYDYINDAVRILVLLNAVKDIRSVKMTVQKIMLYDYYLKFPCTMLGDDVQELNIRWNFDECYAFFHWKPDLIRYRQSLNYLISKKLIIREIADSSGDFKITDDGIRALNSIDSSYRAKLTSMATGFIPKIIKLSDSKISEIISEKAKTYLKTGGVKVEAQD